MLSKKPKRVNTYHELGIVFYIIKQVEEVGEENGVSLVSSLTLEIGQVSGVLHDYLEDAGIGLAVSQSL